MSFGSISDIIVTDDLSKALAAVDPQTLVLTEEALWTPYGDPDGMRAGCGVSRSAASCPSLSTPGLFASRGSISASMVRWRELLELEEYRAAQRPGLAFTSSAHD